jgi:hypothetical protein
MVLKPGIRNWIRIRIKIGADTQPWAVLEEKLWSEIEFDFPLTSVADSGCLYNPTLFIPDPGLGKFPEKNFLSQNRKLISQELFHPRP